jgi:cell volume regulation protein A
MTSTALPLIAVGAVLLLGALGDVMFQRTGVPDLIFLMIAGLLLGPVSGLVPRSDVEAFAPQVASVGLVLAIFETGTKLKQSASTRSSSRGALLAGIAFGASIGLVVPLMMIAAMAGLLDPSFGPAHALVVAAALGAGAATVSVPAIGKARLDTPTQGLLEDESVLGTAFAVVVVALALDAVTAPGLDFAGRLVSIVSAASIGAAIGLVAGLAWVAFLRAVRSSDHAFSLSFAVLLIVFASARLAHGDGLLAVFAFSVAAANADSIAQRIGWAPSPVQVADGTVQRSVLALWVRAAVFVTAGMMAAPPWPALGLGAVAAVLVAAGRVPAALAALRLRGDAVSSRWVVLLATPRGMPSIALLLAPAVVAMPGSASIASVGVSAVLWSVVLFVSFVLLLQRIAPAELSPRTADSDEPPCTLRLIDSTARPAVVVPSSIALASAGDDAGWEGESGPLSTRTPVPLPASRRAADTARATMASAPDAEAVDVEEARETPRRYPAPPPVGGGHRR